MFQTFRGSPALSEFRIQGLMQKFQQNQLPISPVIDFVGIFALSLEYGIQKGRVSLEKFETYGYL